MNFRHYKLQAPQPFPLCTWASVGACMGICGPKPTGNRQIGRIRVKIKQLIRM